MATADAHNAQKGLAQVREQLAVAKQAKSDAWSTITELRRIIRSHNTLTKDVMETNQQQLHEWHRKYCEKHGALVQARAKYQEVQSQNEELEELKSSQYTKL